MVLHCWLWCAGCFSQDTYLLYDNDNDNDNDKRKRMRAHRDEEQVERLARSKKVCSVFLSHSLVLFF